MDRVPDEIEDAHLDYGLHCHRKIFAAYRQTFADYNLLEPTIRWEAYVIVQRTEQQIAWVRDRATEEVSPSAPDQARKLSGGQSGKLDAMAEEIVPWQAFAVSIKQPFR